MSSITFADHKLGGRITASCDAIAAGHLNRAAGILAELADELNQEATEAGLLAPDEAPAPVAAPVEPEPAAPQLATASASADLQSCARNAHSFGPADPVSGWHTCLGCGIVWVSAPGDSSIDIGARGE